MKHWSWIAASSTGTSHLKHGLPLQDAHACTTVAVREPARTPSPSTSLVKENGRSCRRTIDASIDNIGGNNPAEEWFVAVACDGAGSASHGRQGAVITCRTLREAARRHLKTATTPLPSAETVQSWTDEARRRIRFAAESRGLNPRDFACTLVFALSNGQQTLVAHIGDGGIVARRSDDPTWQALSWPDHGEYASTTRFVTDEPPAALRTHITHQPIDALALFSDGIERMVLDMATQTPFARFFSAMAAPLLTHAAATPAPPSSHVSMATDQPANQPANRSASQPADHAADQQNTRADKEPPCFGRQRGLSAQLKAYLDSEAVNSRTDDDKTLVLAVLLPASPQNP